MKEKRKAITSYKTVYIAYDGEEFDEKSECETYEKTARAKYFNAFNKTVVGTMDEYEMFGIGSDSNTVYVLDIKTEKDVYSVLNYVVLINNLSDTSNEYCQKQIDTIEEKLVDALKEHRHILLGKNDCDDCCWIYGTPYSIMQHINENIHNIVAGSNGI